MLQPSPLRVLGKSLYTEKNVLSSYYIELMFTIVSITIDVWIRLSIKYAYSLLISDEVVDTEVLLQINKNIVY